MIAFDGNFYIIETCLRSYNPSTLDPSSQGREKATDRQVVGPATARRSSLNWQKNDDGQNKKESLAGVVGHGKLW